MKHFRDYPSAENKCGQPKTEPEPLDNYAEIDDLASCECGACVAVVVVAWLEDHPAQKLAKREFGARLLLDL